MRLNTNNSKKFVFLPSVFVHVQACADLKSLLKTAKLLIPKYSSYNI